MKEKATWILFKQQMRYIESEIKQEAEDEELKHLDRMLAYYTAGMICFGIAAICIFA